jgi:hypothetical protein
MQLPSSIEKLFNTTYNDMKAARLRTAMECNNLQAALKDINVSFTTKINKSKKHGREFIVMLPVPQETTEATEEVHVD